MQIVNFNLHSSPWMDGWMDGWLDGFSLSIHAEMSTIFCIHKYAIMPRIKHSVHSY